MPVNFEPLRNRALRDSIASAIRDAIASGRLRPGDPVPEAQIAEQMEVSRSPVREAFRKLEEQGLLVTYPHRGTYVALFTEQDARDIYQLRTGLEGLAARWTVQQGGGPDLVDRLQRLVQRMAAIVDTDRWTEMAEIDAEFHDTIVRAAENSHLYQIWRSIDPFVWMMVGLIRAGQGAVPARLVPEHEAVVAGIASGDALLAEQAVSDHIMNRREVALNALREELAHSDNGSANGFNS